MPHEPSDILFLNIIDALEAEKAALMSGDFSMLADIQPPKQRLLKLYDSQRNSGKAELEQIVSRIARNQALLEEAERGIQDAALLIKRLRNARETLETYDQTGHSRQTPTTISHRLKLRR